MSKRDLKKYLNDLTKIQLETQIVELYEKFSAVKTYYDFAFNPKEDKLLQESKLKISNEYFPVKTGARSKKPKMRRSVAQKYIKHFVLLGVDPFVTADLMFYTIEIAQVFAEERRALTAESFYKSMFNSFEQAVQYTIANGIFNEFKPRIAIIQDKTNQQKWFNKQNFIALMERIEY